MSLKDPIKKSNKPNRQPSFMPIVPSKENILHNHNNNNNNNNIVIPNQNTPNHLTSSTSTTPHLHKVLGITTPTVAAMSCSADGVLAYPAGCVVVLYDVRKDTQSYLMNATRKAIISLSWSPDGRYVVTGEQGHKPLVRVWEYSSLRELVSLAGHTHGIEYVRFLPDQSYVISVGAEHDKSVFVWCWRSQTKIGANNKTFKVNCMSVSEDGSFFVLVGLRTVRFCQFDAELSHRSRRVNSVVSRAAVLGAHQSLNYIAVCCSRAKLGATGSDRQIKTFVLSQRGIMLILNSDREVVSWFDTQIRLARCIAVCGKYFFCGGLNALVRIFEMPSFQYVTCMPLAMSSETAEKLYPDENRHHPTTLGLTVFLDESLLISSYSNHSIYIWNIANLLNSQPNTKVLIQDEPIRTFLFHSSQVWAVEIYPAHLKYSSLPPCFITGSADGTIRIWKFSLTVDETSSDSSCLSGFNCPELIHLLAPHDQPKELQDNASGIKCIRTSEAGLYMAAGEKGGSIRVYDLLTMKQIYCIPVHNGEVLQVDFSPEIVNFPSLMASSGKDRTIQVYNIDDNFSQLQSLSAHSGAVTCMQFYSRDPKDSIPSLYLISCATDRSIKLFLFHISTLTFEMKHHIVNNTSIYGMDIDSVRQRIAVAGQDRNVRFYSLEELSTRSIGKLSGSGEEKGFSHIAFDPTGRYLVTSSVQKYVLLFDTYTKTFLSHVYGHSEMILGVRFSRDGRYFVSVGGDGCVFVWKLPNDVTQFIHKHIAYDVGGVCGDSNMIKNGCEQLFTPKQSVYNSEDPLPHSTPAATKDTTTWVHTTISKLPPWAQRHLISNTDDQSVKHSLTPDARSTKSEWGLPIPSGKWAQRAESMMNLTTPDLNTAMIDNSFSTQSSRSNKGVLTVDDVDESLTSENQPFTPYIKHSGEAPKFDPLCVVVGSNLKHRSTSLSLLYEQRKDDIALASMVQVSRPSPIEEISDVENIELSLDVSENPFAEETEVLSVSQPLACVDTSLLASVATSRSTLCYSGSESDHTPTSSPKLKVKRDLSRSAVLERSSSMLSLSRNKHEHTKPAMTHPLFNASSLQHLTNLSPSLSPAGESKLLQKFNESNSSFSFSTNSISSAGNESILSRAVLKCGRGKKKLPCIPDTHTANSAKQSTPIRSETLGEKIRDNLDTFVTRTDGLTPELIAKAYPEYGSIVELAWKIVRGRYKSKDIAVNTDALVGGESDREEAIENVSDKLTKLQEVVNELANCFSELK